MSKTVLIVDDSQFVRNYHGAILKSAGVEVLLASDGQQALELLFSNSCDLVLTDINMQHMDGYELIRRIRAESRYADLPIVIASTECGDHDKLKGFEAGANLYLVKPCAPNVMIENLKMAMTAQ